MCGNVSNAFSNQASTDPIWSLNEGYGYGENILYSIISCRDGGFLTTGTVDLGRCSVVLLRINDNGEIIWRSVFQDFPSQVGREVIECRDGGYAIIGCVPTTNYYAILLRIDDSGLISWIRTFDQPPFFNQGLALVECPSGGFAFAGSILDSSLQNSDFWLVRTDAFGNLAWEVTYGGNEDDICYSLAVTYDQGFILAGSTKSYGEGSEDAWVVKTDMNGVEEWNTTYGGTSREVCNDIITTSLGQYVFVGETADTENTLPDGFACSISTNGKIQWNTSLGGNLLDICYSIIECVGGGYAITGRTSGNLWLVRLNGTGQYLWSKSYGGTEEDEGRSILQAANGDLVMVGMSTVEQWHEAHLRKHAWVIRVPNAPPQDATTPKYGSPNIILISAGTGLAVLVLLGSYLLWFRSQREISTPYTKPSKQILEKSFQSPRLLEDLVSMFTGSMRCAKCNEIVPKANVRCSKCTAHLYCCIFCGAIIRKDDLVMFCPKCGAIAHQTHMREWLAKRPFCPRCGMRLIGSENLNAI